MTIPANHLFIILTYWCDLEINLKLDFITHIINYLKSDFNQIIQR